MSLEKIHLKSTTRMTLNDRFTGLKNIPPETPQVRVTGLEQYQAQTKNRRLAQQMANRPGITPAAQKINQKSLKQRLGVKGRLTIAGRGGAQRGALQNITLRGGRGARGIVRNRGQWNVVSNINNRGTRGMRGGFGGSPRGNTINRGTRGSPRMRGNFSSRGVSRGGKFNVNRGGQQGRTFTRGGRGQSRGRGGSRGRGQTRGRGQSKGRGGGLNVTKEQLDSQLDVYMSRTQSRLNAQLDAYMATK